MKWKYCEHVISHRCFSSPFSNTSIQNQPITNQSSIYVFIFAIRFTCGVENILDMTSSVDMLQYMSWVLLLSCPVLGCPLLFLLLHGNEYLLIFTTYLLWRLSTSLTHSVTDWLSLGSRRTGRTWTWAKFIFLEWHLIDDSPYRSSAENDILLTYLSATLQPTIEACYLVVREVDKWTEIEASIWKVWIFLFLQISKPKNYLRFFIS